MAKSLGIESLFRNQVSEMTKEANALRNDALSQSSHPILWVDALHEKVRIDGKIVRIAILVAYGVDEHGQRDILAIKPMLEDPKESCLQLFRGLQERRLYTPQLAVSDAHTGLVAAIRKVFPGASRQRCKVHFMRNILAHIPHKDKDAFAQNLKTIWLAPTREHAHRLAEEICRQYKHRFPKAIRCPEDCLEDSVLFYTFQQLDGRKISYTNMLKCLNWKIRCRNDLVGIFPSAVASTSHRSPPASWNMWKIGPLPERTSVSSLFKLCYDRLLNFSFFGAPFFANNT